MKLEKHLTIALILTLLLSLPALGYDDVPEDSPSYTPIQYLSNLGIISGYDDNTFRPKSIITTTAALKITLESAKPGYFSGQRLTSLKKTELPYENISAEDWFFPYLAYAYQNDLLPDKENFEPTETIKRKDLIKLLIQAFKRETNDKVDILFADVPPTDEYYPYFAYAYWNNLVLPTEENNYKPNGNVSREEMAVLAYRMIFAGRLESVFRIIPTKISCKATFYSDFFDGRSTANGEIFRQDLLTAASLNLPFDTKLKITDPETGAAVIVRINDRGPYDDRFCLDLSRSAFETFADTDKGWIRIEYEIID